MLIGILADTHDRLARTEAAVHLLREAGAAALIHCGDLATPPIVAACSVLPCWFTFGNHDSDSVPDLRAAAEQHGAVCLEWGGVVDLGGRRLGVVHGHMTIDVRRVLAERPDYLFSGHSHLFSDSTVDGVRRINPGALHRTDHHSVALLDLASGDLRRIPVHAVRRSSPPRQ